MEEVLIVLILIVAILWIAMMAYSWLDTNEQGESHMKKFGSWLWRKIRGSDFDGDEDQYVVGEGILHFVILFITFFLLLFGGLGTIGALVAGVCFGGIVALLTTVISGSSFKFAGMRIIDSIIGLFKIKTRGSRMKEFGSWLWRKIRGSDANKASYEQKSTEILITTIGITLATTAFVSYYQILSISHMPPLIVGSVIASALLGIISSTVFNSLLIRSGRAALLSPITLLDWLFTHSQGESRMKKALSFLWRKIRGTDVQKCKFIETSGDDTTFVYGLNKSAAMLAEFTMWAGIYNVRILALLEVELEGMIVYIAYFVTGLISIRVFNNILFRTIKGIVWSPVYVLRWMQSISFHPKLEKDPNDIDTYQFSMSIFQRGKVSPEVKKLRKELQRIEKKDIPGVNERLGNIAQQITQFEAQKSSANAQRNKIVMNPKFELQVAELDVYIRELIDSAALAEESKAEIEEARTTIESEIGRIRGLIDERQLAQEVDAFLESAKRASTSTADSLTSEIEEARDILMGVVGRVRQLCDKSAISLDNALDAPAGTFLDEVDANETALQDGVVSPAREAERRKLEEPVPA